MRLLLAPSTFTPSLLLASAAFPAAVEADDIRAHRVERGFACDYDAIAVVAGNDVRLQSADGVSLRAPGQHDAIPALPRSNAPVESVPM